MKKILLTILGVALIAAPLSAQTRQRTGTAIPRAGTTPNYDVVLRVPKLRVDSIGLVVDSVRVQLSLNAQAANLVSITAGADVGIDSVSLGISGVRAEAYLFVDLDNVSRIVNRAIATLDKNPEILTGLLQTVDTLVGTVGSAGQTLLQPGGVASQAVGAVGQTLQNVTAPGGLLSQTVNTLGQTVVRSVETAGTIVERTVDSTGKIVGSRSLGSALSLPLVGETRNAAGQIVRQVRDTTGSVIELVLDSAGKISTARVLSAATR